MERISRGLSFSARIYCMRINIRWTRPFPMVIEEGHDE
jgi:hypothetical protein